MNPENKVCLITGASSGIGAATARMLAAEGARVVLAARRADRLSALAAELPDALAVPTDVTDSEQVSRLVRRASQRYGRIDVLINNAGQGLHVPLVDLKAPDLRAVFELNVIAPLTLMQMVLPSMQRAGAGAIVNVSSATSLRVFPGLGGYAATKAALNMLSQAARIEFADAKATVSVVYPSVTATEFHDHLRAGSLVRSARGITPDPPELAAQSILFALETATPHVLVADPPRAIEPGTDDAWGRLLARQAPRPDSAQHEGEEPAR
jgi:NADP-dependent 3-hydroxy acid dehydrogenase YdfG